MEYWIVALGVFGIGRAALLLWDEEQPYLTFYLLVAAVVWPVTLVLILCAAAFGIYLGIDKD